MEDKMIIKSAERTETNTYKLEIQAEKHEFDDALEQSYKKNADKFVIQGFRRGKAPRRIIERAYGPSVFYEDAINIAYPEIYAAAIKQAGIEPVDNADVELLDVDDSGFTFVAMVTVKPEVKLSEYKGLKVTKRHTEVTEAEVEADLGKKRELASRMETVDRPSENGDTVVIDFEGFIDDIPFDGGKAERHSLKLGSMSFIPGFEDQVVGMATGDKKDVAVMFPEDYRANDLAGKEAVFKVKVHEIKEQILPDLDDELAKDISEFETLEELKTDIRQKLEKSSVENAEREFEENVIDKLVENMQVEIPACMIEQQLDRIASDFEYRLRAQGVTFNAYLEMNEMTNDSFRDIFRERAEHQVKVSLALEAVALAENVSVTDEELESEYSKMAEQIKSSIEDIKMHMPKEAIEEDIIRQKVVEFIKSNAEIIDSDAIVETNSDAEDAYEEATEEE